ncbi:hypothetical protein WMF31_32390 [Sorangium sp. So ce1036]|uniref:hypothetical protein n=1 Tax=Sorangium sp. So ce1036 TaxID=3133328 RepID=UPI003F110823
MKVRSSLLITLCALLACGCASSSLNPPSGPESTGNAASASDGVPSPGAPPPAGAPAATPARPRGRAYPPEELRRVARIAAARCKKANTPTDSACLLTEAAAFLKFRPEDPDCRFVAGTALSVAECTDFNEGCHSVDPADLEHQLAALQNAGKECHREPTDRERDEVLKLAGAK